MAESKLGELNVMYVAVEEVDPHPDNANVGDVEAIKESISVNGYYAPLIVQSSTGYILAGNHRYAAAQALGFEKVPVIYLDVDDEEAKRIMVADNRTTRLGHDDDEALSALLTELGDSEVGLLGTGFNHADLQSLQDKLEKFDADLMPEPEVEDGFGKQQEDWALEVLEGPGGTCSSILVHRYDRGPISAEEYNRVRVALGLGRASRGALATTGIESWS
jgi:hypothetical protein